LGEVLRRVSYRLRHVLGSLFTSRIDEARGGAAIQRRRDPGEEEKVRRTGGLIVMLLVTLALAAPAAAQAPSEGWQGWTWSSVVERLTGWAGGVGRVFAASETGTEEGEETPMPTEAPTALLSEEECNEHPQAWPHIDPNG
jgi:hypothetical protein